MTLPADDHCDVAPASADQTALLPVAAIVADFDVPARRTHDALTALGAAAAAGPVSADLGADRVRVLEGQPGVGFLGQAAEVVVQAQEDLPRLLT